LYIIGKQNTGSAGQVYDGHDWHVSIDAYCLFLLLCLNVFHMSMEWYAIVAFITLIAGMPAQLLATAG
jgi:hypothetical protein